MSEQPQDVENYQGTTEEISFRTIVLEQYRRVLRLGSVEFHGGFWMETTDKKGKESLSYIPATHESFSNAVNMLASGLHAYFDKAMSTAWAKAVSDNAAKKTEYEKKKRQGDEAHNNVVNNQWHHERAIIQQELFIALSDFLKREGYLSDDDVVDE